MPGARKATGSIFFDTPGVPWFLKLPLPLMPIVELLGVFTKPFALLVRLFANITAGHIVKLGFVEPDNLFSAT
ncbi:MAG: F0F1 ATP synthase subunit A [Bacteroidales bacterium]|nr:F0F1 ATP synthase subunit A [Bacteroidales bacterium]